MAQLSMIGTFTWDIDPVMVELGPLRVHYYGAIFALTILAGFGLWRWQMGRGGHARETANRFFIYGVLATIVGARAGHCLFYEPDRYLAKPLEMLKFWQGGLASHGAAIGLGIALVLFARLEKLSLAEIGDRFAMPAAVGSAGIRLGNFFNSEIVGRATDLPWAVRFMRYDGARVARHPSQLYEFAMGLAVLAVLVLVDRLAGREKRSAGLLSGLFLVLYFTGRFFVEFVKEYQALQNSVLTMGQYLSIVPVLVGVAVLVWAIRRHEPVEPKLSRTDKLVLEHAREGQDGSPAPEKRKRRKRKK